MFVMLVVFAFGIGAVYAHRLRSDFDSQLNNEARKLAAKLEVQCSSTSASCQTLTVYPNLNDFDGIADSASRVLTVAGAILPGSSQLNLGSAYIDGPLADVSGYRVATVPAEVDFYGQSTTFYVQFARPLDSLNGQIAALEALLVIGVIAGSMIAFGAASLVARRAIAPIAELTAAAEEIERTRDPTRTLPQPTADDEIAELSRTLSAMLASLADARGETEATLERQRAFVADASHELRTPLTSVLANLELLVDSLRGEERDAALSALRSTQRMRRLVADLLLLARADVRRTAPAAPVDLAEIVIAAASELEPTSGEHMLELRVKPAPMLGSGDDLQRVAINLIGNALRHTPPGTRVTASTRPLPDGGAELVVADDGPGIAPDIQAHLFERFARARGEGDSSFGLGLAIVRAVTEAHGGTISVSSKPGKGARFTLRFPPAGAAPIPVLEAPEPATQTPDR
jgi:signal transduction histidine kinase